MADFVWAIDEDGKPTKCKAKPENRGKRNCKHKFHALENQTKEEFFSQFMINSKNDLNINKIDHNKQLPNQKDIIKNVIGNVNEVYDSWEEAFNSNIPDYFNYIDDNGNRVPGVDTHIEEMIDPDDKNSTLIKMTFSYKGKDYEQEFSIPKVDEYGQININGVEYRCLPSLSKEKQGIVSTKDNLLLKDSERNVLCVVNKETGVAKILDEEVPLEEIEKYIKGEKCNLTDSQKERIDKLDPIGKERILNEGFDNLRELPLDKPNDISFRQVSVYEDRVCYTIGKHLRSTASVFRKREKNGNEQDFSLGNITEDIKKDLTANGNVHIAENLNPIAAISQCERLSYIGDVGWSRNHKFPDIVRFPHESHRGIVDSNDVSSGRNVGTTIAIKGYVDKDKLIKKDENRLSGSDFVPYLNNSDPNRGSMAVGQMKQAVPIIGGEDPKLSTKGWDSIKGAKIGVNLNVAYVAESGVFEDAVVLSESAAKKMTTVQSQSYKMKEEPKSFYKVGDEVIKGTRIGGVEVKYSGKIKSMYNGKLEVETVYPMTPGDKLAGRHGNKGTVSEIRPDKDMPKVNGKNADIIMSPIGVAGRGNLGQIYEVNDGDLNKKSKIEYKGRTIEGTGGNQFILRLNHIAEKKLSSYSTQRRADKEFKGQRFGEMENIVMTSSEDRLKILNYMKHQEAQDGENKLINALKAVGVDMMGNN